METGAIYGFMGPNGAGKTTLIRLLLGLLPHHTGGIMLFGKPFKENRVEILSKTGCLVEQPSLYENLTGRDSLNITCMIRGLQKLVTHIGILRKGELMIATPPFFHENTWGPLPEHEWYSIGFFILFCSLGYWNFTRNFAGNH